MDKLFVKFVKTSEKNRKLTHDGGTRTSPWTDCKVSSLAYKIRVINRATSLFFSNLRTVLGTFWDVVLIPGRRNRGKAASFAGVVLHFSAERGG